MSVIYQIAIYLYGFFIRVASLFNPKARLWVVGRKGWHIRIEESIDPNKPLAWFHCASLGEFEQGRPVLEAFKEKHPAYQILLTFFSPSGYEVRKDYPDADHVFYLPLDTHTNARKFIDMVNPDLVFFVKYEFWFNYLALLKKNGIPVFLVSAVFRENQHFFKSYGKWFRKMLSGYAQIFVQDRSSLRLLKSIDITNVVVSGDTRFDRVATVVKEPSTITQMEAMNIDKPVLLAGSTWPPDEEILIKLIEEYGSRILTIIAPHEVHEKRITEIESKFPGKTVRFSQLNGQPVDQDMIFIIDSIGLLLHLYRYASVAYIGGGFGVGIHNILEACAFGKPVIFGPKYEKFREARDLVEKGGAFAVSNEKELLSLAGKLLGDNEFYLSASNACRRYVEEEQGATGRIISTIEPYMKNVK